MLSTMQDSYPLTVQELFEHGARIYADSEVVTFTGTGTRRARFDPLGRPLACVVLKEGSATTFAQLQSFLCLRVARWWLPERWAVIEEVPKTSVGKFDKKLLRTRFANGDLFVIHLSRQERSE
jgi:hypothetical protein